ncbi:MAG: hypothetical protein AAF632_17235 [Bacteroidota bacterium]
MKAVSPKVGKEALTIAERLLQEGREQGIERGIEQKTLQAIAKAIQQGILTLEQIAEMLEVPLDTVIQVRDSLEKG